MTHGVIPLPTGPEPIAPLQGTLALDLAPHDDPPEVHADPSPRPPTDPTCRELERWCRRFVQAAVEIVGGDRPVTQLVRWTSEEVYDELERRAATVGRAGGHRPGQGRVQPVHPKVVGAHCTLVTPRVAESAVHVRYGRRSRAVAARFELRRTRRDLRPRWICTALEFA